MRKNLIWLFIACLVFFAGCDRFNPINQPVDISAAPTVTPAGSLFETIVPTSTQIPTEAVTLPNNINSTGQIVPAKFELTDGDWLLYNGEYNQASNYYSEMFNNPDSTRIEKANALLGLGRIEYLEKRYQTAITYFDSLIAEYPLTEPAKRANFFLGEIYSLLDDPETAARAYQNFLEAYPQLIGDLIYPKLGDAYTAQGDYINAIESYQAAQQASRDEYEIDELKIKIAQAYQALGENDLAIQLFLDAYNNTQSAYINAKVNLLLGQLYQQLGDTEKAFERYQENVNFWPYTYDAYTALVILIENGQTVDEYQRGLTDYYAGFYGVAVDAFNRYISATPATERNGDVHFFNGLSYIYLEQYDNAIAQWQILVDNFDSSDYWSNGTDEIAYTQWLYLNDPQTAAETYLQFVAEYPNHEDADDFLFFAARMYERADQLELAGQTWERMLREYPANPDVFRSQLLSAISYYRLENFQSSVDNLNTLLQYANTPEDQAAAYFWLGKSYQANQQSNEAIDAWENAFRADANNYYGIRAEQLLNAEQPFMNDPYFNPQVDLKTERQQAEIWLRSTFGIGENVDLSANATLAIDPTAIRGELFWALGLYNDSLAEYELLRESYQNDPINTFRLLERLVDRGHYRAAAFASREIIELANIAADDYLLPPRYLNHLRYATHFEPIVSQAALFYAISPQLIFSQIRQESLFDSRIGSSAGAIGLMQIIPNTGDYINNQLQWDENYETSDLFLPYTSIFMGTYYIDLQRNYFDGQWIPALAAYNAGPGNVQTWLAMAEGDVDLFVEIIRFTETRDYIMNIMETYHAYSVLYANEP